jgi:hypothetical protein
MTQGRGTGVNIWPAEPEPALGERVESQATLHNGESFGAFSSHAGPGVRMGRASRCRSSGVLIGGL